VAQLSPSLNPTRHDAGYFRELDVLQRLQESLPDNYEIFHSVALHTLHEGRDRHGEIDLVVLGPNGAILLIEVKAGDVVLRNGGIFKPYRDREKDVTRQTQTQYAALRSRLAAAHLATDVTNCLVLPDYRVGDAQTVSIPRARIIDASEFEQLGTRVRELLGNGRMHDDAAVNQQRALYVCFNRALADHIGRLAPPRAKVVSFHELCVEHHRQTATEPDFSQPDIFQTLAETYCAAAEHQPARYDLIVIDEGQDFEPAWVGALLPQLQAQGRLYLLEDDAQRLYERDAFDLSDAVTLVCNDNFRSPRTICNVINALGLTDQPIDARSPHEGELPGFRVYASNAELHRETAQAVRDLQARGIALADIAVISGHGRQKSALLNADNIDGYTTKRFTGSYSRDGEPRWTNGDLLVESVYRFKGQSAAAVVLSEFDFPELNDQARHKLFVGMTRAHLAVELVLSKSAEKCLAKAFE